MPFNGSREQTGLFEEFLDVVLAEVELAETCALGAFCGLRDGIGRIEILWCDGVVEGEDFGGGF